MKVSNKEKPLLNEKKIAKVKSLYIGEVIEEFGKKIFNNDITLKLRLSEWVERTTVRTPWMYSSTLLSKKMMKIIQKNSKSYILHAEKFGTKLVANIFGTTKEPTKE